MNDQPRRTEGPVFRLPIARYRFTVEARDRLELPYFAGSMLRGAFGHSLRRLVCLTRAPTCTGCPLRATCAYPRLFEPHDVDVASVGLPAASAQPTPPLAFEPPALGRRSIEPGNSWRFSIKLFGKAIEDLPLVVEAIRRAAEKGFGVRSATGDLVAVDALAAEAAFPLFNPSQALLREWRHLLLQQPAASGLEPLEIHLATPLRMQSNAHRVSAQEIDAPKFVAGILKRARLLMASAGEREARLEVAQWPVKAWVDEARLARLEKHFDWVDWTRHSQRQSKSMSLGGWVGLAYIFGSTPSVRSILALGTSTGLGKETVFGFGQYSLAERMNP